MSVTNNDYKEIFKEAVIEETSTYVTVQRSFDKTLCEEELIWHRDKEDRELYLVKGEGWYLQIDNKLPAPIEKKSIFKIPKETWHRIINKKGVELILNVRKYK